MRSRGKRLAAILGAVALVVCQNGVLEVRAEEPQTSEESPVQEGTDESADRTKEEKDLSSKETTDLENKEADAEQAENKKEVTTENPDKKADETEEKSDAEEEKPADGEVEKEETTSNTLKAPVKAEVKTSEAASAPAPVASAPASADAEPAALAQAPDTRAAQVSPVTDLKWENGTIKFNNPNASKVNFVIHIFKDGKYASPDGKTTTTDASAETSGVVSKNLNWCFERYGNGTYTYKVVTFADGVSTDFNLNSVNGVVSGESEAYVYPGSDSEGQEILPVTELVWPEDQPGMAYFKNPNGKGAKYTVHAYWNNEPFGRASSYLSDNYEKDAYIPVYVFKYEEQMTESGDYMFEVETYDVNGTLIGKASSEVYTYTKPEVKLSVPDKISWNKEGIISCDGPSEEYFDIYSISVIHSGKQLMLFGTNWVSGYVNVQIGNGHMEFNLNELLKAAFGIIPVNGDSVKVRAISSDINKCASGEWSVAAIYSNGSVSNEDERDNSSEKEETEERTSEETVVVEEWKPTTPDEIKRYAAYSREKVGFSVAKENAYAITIQNAMQGKQCFDSFEAVLGDWSMGRTYNILPGGKVAYKADSKASITLNIPKAFQKEGREFRMICVTEKGRPIILNDVDTNPETITFETDTYYAFALIYKDAAK